MSLRFDVGEIKSVHKSPEGFLIVKGTATRTGVFTYRNPDGTIRRELRHPDDVLHPDSLQSLAGKPLTLEHPPELLNPNNVEQYSVGSVGNKIHVVGNGLIEIVGNVHRQDAIAAIESKSKRDLSCGYVCEVVREDGFYNGEPYDFRQKDIRYNHLAHVKQGRAGPECGLHLDAADVASQITEKPFYTNKSDSTIMSTSINLDGVTYQEVPEHFATVVAQKFKELDLLKSRLDAAQEKLETSTTDLETLNEQVEELEIERDRERGRGDALEIQLEEAKEQLFSRADAKKKKKKPPVDEEDMEDDEDDDDEEDDDEDEDEDEDDDEDNTKETLTKLKKKGKNKMAEKKDSNYSFSAHMDAYNEACNAWDSAELLLPGFRKANFDGELTAPEIQALVLQQVNPSLDFSKKSESYIQGRFDALIEAVLDNDNESDKNDTLERTDSSRDYTEQLSKAVGAVRGQGHRPSPTKANQENIARMSKNWQTPLAMSKN